jgi:hypothetical protein
MRKETKINPDALDSEIMELEKKSLENHRENAKEEKLGLTILLYEQRYPEAKDSAESAKKDLEKRAKAIEDDYESALVSVEPETIEKDTLDALAQESKDAVERLREEYKKYIEAKEAINGNK